MYTTENRLLKPFEFDGKDIYSLTGSFDPPFQYKYANRHTKAILKRVIIAILTAQNHYYRECRKPLVYTIVSRKSSFIEVMTCRDLSEESYIDVDRICGELLFYFELLNLGATHIEVDHGKAHLRKKHSWEMSATFRIFFTPLFAEARSVLRGFGDKNKPSERQLSEIIAKISRLYITESTHPTLALSTEIEL